MSDNRRMAEQRTNPAPLSRATFRILDTRYDNLSVSEALSRVNNLLESNRRSSVFFLNFDCLRIAQKDPEYKMILDRADLVLPDGIALKVATSLFGGAMKENCNGTDFSPRVLRLAAERGYKVFLFGGKEGVAEKAGQNITRTIPGLQVVGCHPGFFSSDPSAIQAVNASGADVVLVAMGAPRQEKWIAAHRDALNPRLFLGVGALLDYLSGTIPRAPRWMIRLRLEWLWRIGIDPHRMVRRYLIDGLGFMMRLVFHRIASGK